MRCTCACEPGRIASPMPMALEERVAIAGPCLQRDRGRTVRTADILQALARALEPADQRRAAKVADAVHEGPEPGLAEGRCPAGAGARARCGCRAQVPRHPRPTPLRQTPEPPRCAPPSRPSECAAAAESTGLGRAPAPASAPQTVRRCASTAGTSSASSSSSASACWPVAAAVAASAAAHRVSLQSGVATRPASSGRRASAVT